MNRLLPTQVQDVIRRYIAGEPTTKLAADYSISPVAISGLLKRRGIEIRSNRDSHRTILLDETSFDTISEKSAYWVGFLLADGCVTQRGDDSFCITLRLANKDSDHISAFQTFLKTNAKITEIAGGTQLAIKSSRIAQVLEQYGVTPRKSHSAVAAPILVDNRHFWRGVVDGDGSWGTYGNGQEQVFTFRLYGSHKLLEQFREFCVKHGISQTMSIRPHKSIYILGLSGIAAAHLAEILYLDCTIALYRKRDIAYNAALNIRARAAVMQPMVASTHNTGSVGGQLQATGL